MEDFPQAIDFINETASTCRIMERLSGCSSEGDYAGAQNDEETLFDSCAEQGSGYP